MTLDQCLKLFTMHETLDEDNKWKCEECENSSQAIRKISIWKPSDLLIIHLKRFNHKKEKINGLVQYPIILDISKYVEGTINGNPRYELYSVINHVGGYNGGHYYSYCKHTDGNWFIFNDAAVQPLNQSQIISKEAYILFYQRM